MEFRISTLIHWLHRVADFSSRIQEKFCHTKNIMYFCKIKITMEKCISHTLFHTKQSEYDNIQADRTVFPRMEK